MQKAREDVEASGASRREVQLKDGSERFESDLEAALERGEKEHSKRWNWSWFNEVIFKNLASTVFSLSAAALVIMIGPLFIEALWGRTISIQPFSVPKLVAENGFTPDVTASKLRDVIYTMVSQARITKRYREVTQQNELPDVVVPSVGISVQALAAQVRTFLGITRRQNISGEFTTQGGLLFLSLRLNGKSFFTSQQGVDLNRLDDLMPDAGRAVLDITQPNTLGIVLVGLGAVHGQTPLPAAPETVAAFLAAEARAELAVNTLRLRHAAIRYLHLLAGYPPPTAAAVVSTTFAGIKRAHRRPLNKKTALVVDRLRPALKAIPETLPGLRDRALLLVGFAAALRPSEIARLTIEHATRHAEGIELFLPWRKNDQDARGTRLWLPKGRTDLCPVAALEAWLAAAEITTGPLFRRVWRLPPPRIPRGARRKPVADRYRIGTHPIDTDSIALIVKNSTGLVGFDRAAFAGHSLRRGAISTGVAQGVHIARLKQFSGHASLKSLEEYVELDELRHNHPLKDIL